MDKTRDDTGSENVGRSRGPSAGQAEDATDDDATSPADAIRGLKLGMHRSPVNAPAHDTGVGPIGLRVVKERG